MPNMLRIFLLILLFVAGPSAAVAEDLRYEVLGYGSRHVLVMITGGTGSRLATSMSADGLSARVSGVGVQFIPAEKDRPLPGLVASIQQVKRGLTVDLIVNLSAPVEMNVLPAGSGGVRLFLKRRDSAGQAAAEAAAGSAGGAKSRSSAQGFPLRLKLVDGEGVEANAGLTISFPPLEGLKPKTGLSEELYLLAYTFDIIWAALTSTELEYFSQSGSRKTTVAADEEHQRLEALVQDMTGELVELREALALRDEQIKTAKGVNTP